MKRASRERPKPAARSEGAHNIAGAAPVNGHLVQHGNTKQMIFDIGFLIEYLSSFMTLVSGDVILTGTPHGVVNVVPGDEVICEIDGLGRLSNTIVADAAFGR